MLNDIAVLLKYKIKNNEICCSPINIRPEKMGRISVPPVTQLLRSKWGGGV